MPPLDPLNPSLFRVWVCFFVGGFFSKLRSSVIDQFAEFHKTKWYFLQFLGTNCLKILLPLLPTSYLLQPCTHFSQYFCHIFQRRRRIHSMSISISHRHLHSTNHYSIFNLLVLARRFCRRLQLTTFARRQVWRLHVRVVTRERRVIWRSIATQNFCKTRVWRSIATMGSHNWKSRNIFPLLHIFKLPSKKQIWKLSSARGLDKCGSQGEANLVKLWSKFSLCLHVAITPWHWRNPKKKRQLHSRTYKNK